MNSKIDENQTLRKLQPKSMWYLSILGTLATTQREYVALHAFCRLNVQVVHLISVAFPEKD
jgi:senataxin